MQTPSNPRARAAWSALALGVALAVAACDRHGPVLTGDLVSITVSGVASIEHPGEDSRFTATANFLNGPSRDVTAEASWTAADAVRISAPGTVTAVKYGSGEVVARYRRATGKASVRVAPAGAHLLSGTVRTGTGFPLPGASVEVVSAIGPMSMTTGDDLGEYTLPALGATTVRVQREGFEPQVAEVMVGGDHLLDFVMPAVDPRDDALDGTYTLNISAASSCDMLPVGVRQRTYQAQIGQFGRDLFVLVSGPDLVEGGPVGFTGTRDGDAVRFALRAEWDEGFNLIEEIDNGYLTFSGTADGVITGTQILTTLRGTIGIDLVWDDGPQCDADHSLVLTRVDGQQE